MEVLAPAMVLVCRVCPQEGGVIIYVKTLKTSWHVAPISHFWSFDFLLSQLSVSTCYSYLLSYPLSTLWLVLIFPKRAPKLIWHVYSKYPGLSATGFSDIDAFPLALGFLKTRCLKLIINLKT